MTLYIIGLGLESEKDITVKGLEAVRKCEELYLEDYTSLLQVSKNKLEEFYKKEIILADRKLVENKFTEKIIDAKEKDIGLLVPGTPLAATTHIALMQEAQANKVKVEVIDNASIFTAVGVTGLELYKFGRVASIPFDNATVEMPVKILKENLKIGLHTLVLLDLDKKKGKYLSLKEAITYLEKNKITKEMKAIGCARLGCGNQKIKAGTLSELKKEDFGKAPYCLIIPSEKLHFVEEEMFKRWE